MPKSKLTKNQKEDLIIRLSQALAQIKNPQEAAKLIVDLLTKTEVERIAIRLKVAELLLEEKSYEEIREELRVSSGTIGVVSEWLKVAGDGYRIILGRMENIREIKPERRQWSEIKRRYPAYYWPEMLLFEIMNGATKRQRKKLQNSLEYLDTKTQLYKELSQMFKSGQNFNDSNR